MGSYLMNLSKYYVIFGQSYSNFTHEKPLKESEVISFFWKKSENIKRRKDLTIQKIEEMFLVNIAPLDNFNEYVIVDELTGKILRYSPGDEVILYDSKVEAAKDLSETSNIVSYRLFLENKMKYYAKKQYLKNVKITRDDKDLFDSYHLDKELMRMIITIDKLKHKKKLTNFKELRKETLIKLKQVLKLFNNYQLMKLFDVSEKTINNYINLLTQ